MYINLETQQYPVSETDIRAANPNTSYPTPFPVPEGYAWVFPTPQPELNPVIQLARELAPELTAKGVWEQRWRVESRFVEYTDSSGRLYTVAEQEAAAIAADNLSKRATLRASIIQQTQARLDNFAQTRGYDNILALCTYSTDPNPKFQAEGQYGVQARSTTWNTLYSVLDKVSSYTEAEPYLPALVWPV